MTQVASAAVKRAGNTRVTGKEQYYTPTALADTLTSRVAKLINTLSQTGFAERVIIEPAGGTGAFISAAQHLGASRFLSFDIEPKHSLVVKANFLEQNLGSLAGAVTLGNPPFGRNNALSIPFFNHAAQHSEFIAFIVPRSWRKWSVSNRLNRDFHLVDDLDLTIDYVDDEGNAIAAKKRLNTCFQVWQRRTVKRQIVSVQDHGFVSKTTPMEADVSLTVFGYNCGQLKTNFDRKPNTTQMFLKLNHPQALEALQKADFSRFFKNTAYTEALGFQEINYLLNQTILGNPSLTEMG